MCMSEGGGELFMELYNQVLSFKSILLFFLIIRTGKRAVTIVSYQDR